MRIIEEGRLPDQTLTGRCPHCLCKVECDQNEAEYVVSPQTRRREIPSPVPDGRLRADDLAGAEGQVGVL